jgi:hypothetical protein
MALGYYRDRVLITHIRHIMFIPRILRHILIVGIKINIDLTVIFNGLLHYGSKQFIVQQPFCFIV